jgi:hypothetical protein
MKRLLALAILVASILPLESFQNEPQTISVCDVLRDPVQFNGKMIAVRGFLVSTDEGSWLKGDCKETLVTWGYINTLHISAWCR